MPKKNRSTKHHIAAAEHHLNAARHHYIAAIHHEAEAFESGKEEGKLADKCSRKACERSAKANCAIPPAGGDSSNE